MGSKESFIPALGYQSLNALYDLTISRTMPERKLRVRLADQVNLLPGERLLDFGCGTASQTILQMQRSPDASVTGVDVDPQILALASRKAHEAGLHLRLDQYDGRTLPYPDASFDKVVSSLVFHQLNAERKGLALREIYRVLVPGGELHLGDWGWARSRLLRFAFLAVQILDGFESTRDNVAGLLPWHIADAGFIEVVETGFINCALGTFAFYRARKPSAKTDPA